MRLYRSPTRDIRTNLIDYHICMIRAAEAGKRAVLRERLGGYEPRWTQRVVLRDGTLTISPRWFVKWRNWARIAIVAAVAIGTWHSMGVPLMIPMAARYWVGGSGNVSDNANHWASSSGGAAGASKPGATDDVYFDANSDSGSAFTVTFDENTSWQSFDTPGWTRPLR